MRRSARRDHRAMVTRRVRGAKAPARSGRDRGDRVYWFPDDANPQDVTALRSGDGMPSMAGGVAIHAVAIPWCCSPRGRRHSPDCERAEVPGREPTLSVTSLRRRGPADATGGGTELVYVKGRSEPSTTLEAPKTRGVVVPPDDEETSTSLVLLSPVIPRLPVQCIQNPSSSPLSTHALRDMGTTRADTGSLRR